MRNVDTKWLWFFVIIMEASLLHAALCFRIAISFSVLSMNMLKRRSMRKSRIFHMHQTMGVNGFPIWPHRKLGIIDLYMYAKYYGLKIEGVRVWVRVWGWVWGWVRVCEGVGVGCGWWCEGGVWGWGCGCEGVSLHKREIQSWFIRHVSTLAKESSSGMIRIKYYIS
jgi:hypothetical protein